MKKALTYLLLFASSFLIFAPRAEALTINDFKLSSLSEGQAHVTWTTDVDSTGYLYFGTSDTNMPYRVGDLTVGRSHSADLTGLKKGTDYYYKVVAIDTNGNQVSSNINFLDTDKMTDTTGADIYDFKVVQATEYAVAFSFTTSEKTKATIKLGTDPAKLNKSAGDSSTQSHFLIVNGLNAGTTYHYELVVTDDNKNDNSTSGSVMTSGDMDYDSLKLNDLVPGSAGTSVNLPEGAVISWTSNMLAGASLGYGTAPDKIGSWKTVTDSKTPSKVHQIYIQGLKANSTYYYQIKMSSDMVKNNSLTSSVYYLKTAPLTAAYVQALFPSGSLVKYSGKTYYIYGGQRVLISSNDRQKKISTSSPQSIGQEYFNFLKDGGSYYGMYSEGQAVKDAKKNSVYIINGQYKVPVANWEVFTYLNYTAKDIVTDSNNYLNAYKASSTITNSKQLTVKTNASLNNRLIKVSGNSAVYFVANGLKMPFANAEAFLKAGYSFKNVKTVSAADFNKLGNGPLIY